MANSVDLATLPVPLQNVPAPGYNAIDLRRFALILGQEGVVAANDFKVSQDTGGNRFLRVQPGEAVVQGDSVVEQGRYYCTLLAVEAGLDVAAGDVTNPRIDQVVLEVKDDVHDASGLNKGRLRVVAGTPTGGATLDNRLGVAALPPSCVRLADVLMPIGGAAVTNANIRDRRPWARGAHVNVTRKTNAAGGSDYTTTSASFVDVDASANISPRLELSGVPVRVKVRGRWQNTVSTAKLVLAFYMDGAQLDGEVGPATIPPAINTPESLNHEYELPAPAPGSHYFGPRWLVFGGTGSIQAQGAIPFQFVVEELVAQSANNP